MDPFTIALMGTSILGGIIGKIGQGRQVAQANADKAQASRIEGEMYKMQAVQKAELSRQQLFQTLGVISGIRSERGLNLDSQTGQAIERQTTENAYRNEAVQVLGALNSAQASEWGAAGYSRAAKWAVPLAAVDAGATAAGQALKFRMG